MRHPNGCTNKQTKLTVVINKPYNQELIIVEGECLTLYRVVKHDSEKFKGIQSDVLK